MRRRNREKGKEAECEVVALLRSLFSQVRTKRAGGESAPQDRGRDLLGTPGLCVQVKLRKRLAVEPALAEAAQAAQQGEQPVLFHRRPRGQWKVTIDAEFFVALLRGHPAPPLEAQAVPIDPSDPDEFF